MTDRARFMARQPGFVSISLRRGLDRGAAGFPVFDAAASCGQALLDFMHRKLDEILVDLGAQRPAQVLGIGLSDHAERTR